MPTSNPLTPDRPGPSRRAAVRAIALGLVAAALGPRAALAAQRTPRRLNMVHAHTGERLDAVYREDGILVPDVLPVIDRFLRDFRTGGVFPIDFAALDLLWAVTESCGKSGCEIEVIGGYRSPETNAALRLERNGVAANSQHLYGRAIDLRLRGFSTKGLRDAALALARGGVGYYARADFVHIDTGPVRRW